MLPLNFFFSRRISLRKQLYTHISHPLSLSLSLFVAGRPAGPGQQQRCKERYIVRIVYTLSFTLIYSFIHSFIRSFIQCASAGNGFLFDSWPLPSSSVAAAVALPRAPLGR